MIEMVERVARAIEATMFAPHELPCDEELHAKYCHTARAAIAAMREPAKARLPANPRSHEEIIAEAKERHADALAYLAKN